VNCEWCAKPAETIEKRLTYNHDPKIRPEFHGIVKDSWGYYRCTQPDEWQARYVDLCPSCLQKLEPTTPQEKCPHCGRYSPKAGWQLTGTCSNCAAKYFAQLAKDHFKAEKARAA
jgi:hypothetical protein